MPSDAKLKDRAAPLPDHASRTIDAMLAAVLRGEPGPDWRQTAWRDRAGAVADRIAMHGICALLWDRGRSLTDWPADLRERLRGDVLAATMWELGHRATIAPAIEGLAAAGVPSLILKGSALAYCAYARPHLRIRGDTDLLVAPESLDAARAALERLGFERASQAGEMSDEHEESWYIAGPQGTIHCIDLHWQTMDAPIFEGLLPFSRCMATARPLRAFSPSAMQCDRAEMLLHCIVHRAKHAVTPYFVDGTACKGDKRLIWIADFDLLARRLDDAGWDRFRHLALANQIGPVCLDGLDAAREWFGTLVPDRIIKALQGARTSGRSAYLLRDGQAGRSLKNLRATRGFRQKLRYLKDKAFPSSIFMRNKYPELGDRPLVFLYAWRLGRLFMRD